jgi:hypothetical protein
MSFKEVFPRFPVGTMQKLTDGGFPAQQAFHVEQLVRSVYAAAYLAALQDMGMVLLCGQNPAEFLSTRTVEIAGVHDLK